MLCTFTLFNINNLYTANKSHHLENVNITPYLGTKELQFVTQYVHVSMYEYCIQYNICL